MWKIRFWCQWVWVGNLIFFKVLLKNPAGRHHSGDCFRALCSVNLTELVGFFFSVDFFFFLRPPEDVAGLSLELVSYKINECSFTVRLLLKASLHKRHLGTEASGSNSWFKSSNSWVYKKECLMEWLLELSSLPGFLQCMYSWIP